MKRKEIERTAKDQLEKYGVRSTLQTDYGEPLLLCVTGADSFGFPSPDSDIDIKRLYRAPNNNFLGFRQRVRTFIYMSPDRMLDVAIDEVGHFLSFWQNQTRTE